MAEVQSSPVAKTLFVCLMGFGRPPMAYSVIAIPVSSLFENGSEVKFRRIKTWVGDELSNQSGCGFIKSNLYLIGGMKPLYKEPYYNPSFTRYYSLTEYSTAVFSVDLASGKMLTDELCTDLSFTVKSAPILEFSASKEMLSGKSSPLAVEVGELLYVLAGFPIRGLKEPAFESYNPSKNSWQKLDPPPFLDDMYGCFAGETVQAYVVFGTKIFVSTNHSSFEYDVDAKKWGPCTLFGVVDGFGGPYDYWFHEHGGKTIPYGYPFQFREEALIYDGDSLICIGQSSIVAHRIDGGKVVRTQPLTRLQVLSSTIDHQLADLGNGYFCYIHTIFDFLAGECDDYKLCINLFRVWKLPAADGDECFLDYEICSQICSERRIGDPSVDKVWLPIGSRAWRMEEKQVEKKGKEVEIEEEQSESDIQDYGLEIEDEEEDDLEESRSYGPDHLALGSGPP